MRREMLSCGTPNGGALQCNLCNESGVDMPKKIVIRPLEKKETTGHSGDSNS